MAVITVESLVKRYDELDAVAGIDFTITEGEIVAILGPNGAGKTTTIEILEGYRRRTSGSVEVLGFDPADNARSFRERIGVVLQETSVERDLSVREALEIYGKIYPRRLPVDHLIDIVGLADKADARVKALSGGQKRRLEVALGIVGDPDLVFLDEPTTGFDPSARRQAWTVIENLASLGKTILLTTHYMDEAQHLADRVIVINEGRIVAEGTPETLGGRRSATSIVHFSTVGLPLDDLPLEAGAIEDDVVEVRTDDPTRDVFLLTSWAVDRGLELVDLTVARPSLEDVYLQLTDGDEV